MTVVISGSSQADASSGFGDKSVFSEELAAGLEEAYVHLEFQLSRPRDPSVVNPHLQAVKLHLNCRLN